MKNYKILEKFNKINGVLYHATPLKNLQKIQTYGLKPSYSRSSSEGIYLSNDKAVAKNYACMTPEPYVILTINSSLLDEQKFGPDDYELQEYLDSITDPNDENYGLHYNISASDSLLLCNQVVYFGNIPPEAITDISDDFVC